MNAQDSTRGRLDEAVAAHAEAVALRAELETLRAAEEPARQAAVGARAALAREAGDVERLEGLNLRSVLATLRGSRTEQLHRERTEETAARRAAEVALARFEAAAGRRETVERRLARLGDTAARRETAARAHAEALRHSSDPAAAELDALLTELAGVTEEVTALERVRAAGSRATTSLDAAVAQLSSASSWSTYDTFLGGGLLASSAKHSHVDAASAAIAAAQHDLVELAAVLDDPGAVAALRSDLGIGAGTRTVDIVFDNLLTDWTVRSRIQEAQQRVDTALYAVRSTMARTLQEVTAARARTERLAVRRDRLLGIPPLGRV